MICEDIKKLALDKVKKGECVAKVAKTLEISKRTLLYWVNGRPKKRSTRKAGRPPKISARRKKWVKE